LRDQADLGALNTKLLGVVTSTMQPARFVVAPAVMVEGLGRD
jgi:hypothetical protein